MVRRGFVVQEGVRGCERGWCKRGPQSGTAAMNGWSSMSEGDCSSSSVVEIKVSKSPS
jgi:hypothetical protein